MFLRKSTILFMAMAAVYVTAGEDVVTDSEVVEIPDKPISMPSGLEECDPEMIGFELITGNVFSAPANVLDSIPGTLMLTDCLETCQGNDSCQSVNYETGLCVLFNSNSDILPDSLGELFHVLIDELIVNIIKDIQTDKEE
ncbi:hypothetical protein WA026_003645 [Henosepilachna vigintioctopunctata]|uniref:Apple domain-containing protein n=1 Tax=Henosepilachna vigintioctopunctata TaxID=420089 RepID=A0AAW1UF74_9CUCU